MHEIRATVPPELTEEAARLAHGAGIERVSVAEVFIHGPGLRPAGRERRNLHAEGAGLCRCPAELPRAFGGRLYAYIARGAVHREQRVPGQPDPADERAFHRRYPGSLANEPRHDQLCGPRGCRWDSARDRHHR